jgi:hypothetical protein
MTSQRRERLGAQSAVAKGNKRIGQWINIPPKAWSSFHTYALQEAGLVRINEWGTPELKLTEPTSFPQ